MSTFYPYFEKQFKTSQRADHINSVEKTAKRYPCIKLVHNNDWNDYGYYTWFVMWYLQDPEKYALVGDLKIMNRNGDAYEKMDDCFERLDEDFCSVGMNMFYYSNLKSMFKKNEVKGILAALCDCAINTQIYEKFNGYEAFIHSLCRDIATDKALREAKFLLEERNLSDAYSFDYRFTPIYNKYVYAMWNIRFEYDCVPYKRTSSVIGENGVGKTQLMANMVEALVMEDSPDINRQPMLSAIMVICSSKFDAYNKICIEQTRVPLMVCDVVQTNDAYDRLKCSIEVILNRGTYFRNNEMMLIADRYVQMLYSQLGNCVEDLFLLDKGTENEEDKGQKRLLNTLRLDELVKQLSTGQLQLFCLITYVYAHIHLNSLIVIDEPEVHLHPRLITKFIVVLNDLLEIFDSYAMIATHSPLVVRECVSDNVFMMVRSQDDIPTIGKVEFDTFGEDITTLYENIFGCDVRNSFFYHTVGNMAGVVGSSSYKSVVDELKQNNVDLPLNGRMLVREYFESQVNNI